MYSDPSSYRLPTTFSLERDPQFFCNDEFNDAPQMRKAVCEVIARKIVRLGVTNKITVARRLVKGYPGYKEGFNMLHKHYRNKVKKQTLKTLYPPVNREIFEYNCLYYANRRKKFLEYMAKTLWYRLVSKGINAYLETKK